MTIQRAPHVLVVGAGIIGAALAYYLSKAGARVTVLGARQARHCATGASFAWINATRGNPRPYFDLRVASMDEWRRLESEIGGLNISWTGSLLWEHLNADQLNAFVQEHRSWDYKIRRIDRGEVRQMEPALKILPPGAAFASQEGALDPVVTTDALLAAASMQGARLQTPVEVHDIVLERNQVRGVKTSAGDIAADHLVVAAGIRCADLLSPLGFHLPMDNRDGLQVQTKPIPPVLNHIVIGEDIDMRQDTGGRFHAGSSFEGTPLTDDPDRLAAGLISRIEDLVELSGPLELERWTIGRRPMPADGFPAVGPVPGVEGLSVAVTHSGITLGPAIGRFMAGEILSGEIEPLLAPYRPDRFSRP